MLVRTGRTLRDTLAPPAPSWREVFVLVHHSPEDSPLRRVMQACGHSPAEHLQLLTLHGIAVSNWQRGGGKRADWPKPPPCLDDKRDQTKYGGSGEGMTLEQASEWLGWSR